MQRRTFLGALGAGMMQARPALAEDPLYLITYDHGGLILWGAEHFATLLRDAVAWLERYPGFKIGLDNEAYTYDDLAANAPAVLAELRDYLSRFRGRMGIGTCTYGQPLSCFIGDESNIRQIEYGLAAVRRHFGAAPEIYMMSEHAMHSQMPQILSGFGFRAAIMRTHFMMYGFNPIFDVPIGWWSGADGSRLPAVPTYPGQGNAFGKTTVDNWVLTRCPGPECRGSLDEFRQQFAHIHPLIATRADDSALRREDLVRMTENRPDCRWLLLEDLPGVLPKPASEMKTAPNDFVVRMPWGYCGNEIWNLSRRAEVSVLTAERLAALELLVGGGEDREAELASAWKNLLVAQHHDIQICGLLPDARRFLGSSLRSSGRVAESSLRRVASGMKGGAGGQITVFNPSSWRRKEWVEVTFRLPNRFAEAVDLQHAGQPAQAVLISALRGSSQAIQEGHVRLLADVPPLAAVSYSILPAKQAMALPERIAVSSSPLRVETPFWRVEFHPEGGIAALSSRDSGRPVFAPGRRSCMFTGLVEGRPCESRGHWRLLPRPEGAPWADAREEGMIGGIPYRCDLRMWADTPRLDFRARFEFEGQKIGRLSEQRRDQVSPFVHEEKLRFKLYPLTGPGAAGVRDLPFVIAETADRYVEGNYWTAIAGAEGGLAFFNRGTMGSVRELDGGFALPLAYSMYYVWGTRILDGEYLYEFAVWPFQGAWKKADLHRRALEYNFPLPACATETGSGRLGEVATPVDFASENVLVSAMYSQAGRVHVRMFEHAGGRADVRIRSAGQSFREVDLAGRQLDDVGDALSFAPWQIRTLRFEARNGVR